MALTPGTRLGPYEITAQIGAGGMGEVYRATDSHLKRSVAIKVLPASVAGDADRLARFQREAEVLAALNHPNIAAIYGLEKTPDLTALVMELVEGADLSIHIARGPIPLADALPIARQIAEALEAAHEQGIVHRDLKPANIKVRDDGTVKVLDFGLAKALDPLAASGAAAALANSPTITSPALTEHGVILGTAAYMAPEQALGKAIDKRADIWAFGAVLYEMLIGQRAFTGEGTSDTLASVLKDDVKWGALPPDTPPHIRRLLHRCLEKDRKRRLRDIGDVLFELDDAGVVTPSVATPIAPAPRRTRERVIWLAALVSVGAALGAAGWWLRAPAVLPETRLEIVAPLTTNTSFALSPHGRQVVFIAPSGGQNMLWLRALDATAARPLSGTEAGTNPFWSPDSQSIGFFAEPKLKRLDLVTGAVQTITDAMSTQGGAWAPSNVILYRRPGVPDLARISASGGEPGSATKLADGAIADGQPQFLPDGRQFIFSRNGPESVRGIYLGSLDTQEIARLTDANGVGRYLAPGWLAYARQDSLVARRLDLARKALSGEVVLIAESVFSSTNPDPARRTAFSVSDQGLIAYRTGSVLRRQLTWFDRNGKALGALGQADDMIRAPELSPDGRRVAVDRPGQGNNDIWVVDALRTTRLTFDPATEQFPLWSPDGARIAFTTTRNGRAGLYAKAANGGGAEELIAERPASLTALHAATSWSRDGRFILVDVNSATTREDVWVLPLAGDRKPYPFLNGSDAERLALFSPDGHWVAYQSHESGRAEIYVRPFPGPGGQWLVSTSGGAGPRWRHDGKELYWIAPDAKLMAAPMTVSGTSIEPGAPVALFQTSIFLGGGSQPNRGQYQVAPDGRFLINTVLSEEAVMPITIVQNWRGGK